MQNNAFNSEDLVVYLSVNIDWNLIPKVADVPRSNNHWSWWPSGSNVRIVNVAYNFLNQNPSIVIWKGWHNIWRLPTAPRIRTFTWRMVHGRIPTFEYLYALTIGPQLMCLICELEKEMVVHILWKCRLSVHCWILVENYSGITLLNSNCLEDG